MGLSSCDKVGGHSPWTTQVLLDVANDIAENVPDGGAKQGQNHDHDNGDQNEDQSVLYQTLAFLFRCEQHDFLSFIKEIFSVYARRTG